jgi:flavin-dependent dehydrogenase
MAAQALAPGAALQLRRWGLLPRLAAFHGGEASAGITPQPGLGGDALLAPRRSLLNRVLADAAQEAGAELRQGIRLVDLLRSADGRVSGAALLDVKGKRSGIAVGLVVGADGMGSTVARLTGAPLLRQGLHASAVIHGHWTGLHEDSQGWYWREGAAAGMIPTGGSRHCVLVALPPARLCAGGGQDIAALYHRVLAECAPALAMAVAGARPEGSLVPFSGRRGYLRQACGPGWALVGAANSFVDPLAAHGPSAALRDAELLARAAAQGTAEAFASHARASEALSLPLLTAGDAIASFAWTLEELRRHHRALERAVQAEAEHLAALDSATIPRQQRERAA